jgi:hypothetical protein
MKAALEAWGADSNLFHQGAAKESDDPDVIAATLKKPGVILRRPVGSDGSFGEHAGLPAHLGDSERPAARRSKGRKAKKPTSRPVDKAVERKAAVAFEKEQERRDRERAREEAAKQKGMSAGSRRSTKRKRRWMRPSGSTRIGLRPSGPRSRRSTRNRKPRTPAGKGRGSDWHPRCDAREARSLRRWIAYALRLGLRGVDELSKPLADRVAIGSSRRPFQGTERLVLFSDLSDLMLIPQE